MQVLHGILIFSHQVVFIVDQVLIKRFLYQINNFG
jgi:hypothetical protein